MSADDEETVIARAFGGKPSPEYLMLEHLLRESRELKADVRKLGEQQSELGAGMVRLEGRIERVEQRISDGFIAASERQKRISERVRAVEDDSRRRDAAIEAAAEKREGSLSAELGAVRRDLSGLRESKAEIRGNVRGIVAATSVAWVVLCALAAGAWKFFGGGGHQ